MRILTIDTTNKTLKEELGRFVTNGKTSLKYKGVVSNILAEYIVDNIDKKYINLILKKNGYNYESDFYEYFETNIKKYINRKLRIYDMLINYIKDNDYMNFEGFIQFRLRDYYKNLEKIVGEISREYKNEIKYRNFISIIKEFIKSQVCIVSDLSIYKSHNGKYLLLDDYYNDITEICEKEFIYEFGVENLNKNALILNSILTLAPHTVTFHKFSHTLDYDIIKAVSDVYGDEMHCCNNCIFCSKNK